MTDLETEELAESTSTAVTHGTLYIMREQDYLSGDLFDYYKIGIVRGEKDVKKREAEHSTANPRKISAIIEIQSPEVQKLIYTTPMQFIVFHQANGFSYPEIYSIK